MLERVMLAVFAFLTDWVKNQDGKVVLIFAFCVISVSFLYNENISLKNKISQMQADMDSLRMYVLECELHRRALEIELNNIKKDLNDKAEKSKSGLESRSEKNRKPR